MTAYLRGIIVILLFYTIKSYSQTPGPVFPDQGSVFDVKDADYIPKSGSSLKAIFDIDRKLKDHSTPNPLISSLHRYYNMHVRNGIKENDIHLAFVVHGSSTDHVLKDEAYHKRYGSNNPNTPLIRTLAERGVKMYICGQSASYRKIKKDELLPNVQMALSAMTVLTTFQMEGYGMIKF